MVKPPPTFARLEGLLELGRRDGFDIRPTLLRVLTDLYVQRNAHAPEDESYFTELALRLIDAVDVSARATLATRLATYPSAPRAVIQRLARDDFEVAEPVLRLSACLTPADFDAIARECGAAHADIIAARGHRVAEEPSADIAPAISPAVEAEASELCELFFAADAVERRLILMSLDFAADVPMAPPAPLQRNDIWRLETAALQHNSEMVVHELERALTISARQARRIVVDELGEPIVVAAKALRLPADVLQRMLLFLNPRVGRSVDRVYKLASLYGEITVDAALRLLAIWRDADPVRSRPAGHQSALTRSTGDGSSNEGRWRAATAQHQWTPQREAPLIERADRVMTNKG